MHVITLYFVQHEGGKLLMSESFPPDEFLLKPGQTLHNRYVILDIISSGGFGNVYRAKDLTFDNTVAIKEAYYNDEETRKQFEFEAKVLILLNHPNIVRGYEFFEENDRFYLVMGYVDGQSIEDLQIYYFTQQRQPIPSAVVLRFMTQICDAVQAMHDHGILHRDIKPANIKLDQYGRPILLDLGLAKLFKSPDSKTLMAARAFTPGYAPPEQCQEEGSSNHQTDIYALGATMYYSLTGRQPWEAMKRFMEVTQRHKDMPKPSHFWNKVSRDIDGIVLKAMELNSSDRYQSPSAMKQDLEKSLQRVQSAHGKTVPVGVSCPDCHKQNAERDPYCIHCGAKLQRTVIPAMPQAAFEAETVASVTQLETIPLPPTLPAIKQTQTQSMPVASLPQVPEKALPRIVVKAKRSTLAVTAMWLGILSLIPPLVWLPLFGIPTAISSIRIVNRSKKMLRGRWFAIAGIILSLLGILEGFAWIYALLHGMLFS